MDKGFLEGLRIKVFPAAIAMETSTKTPLRELNGVIPRTTQEVQIPPAVNWCTNILIIFSFNCLP